MRFGEREISALVLALAVGGLLFALLDEPNFPRGAPTVDTRPLSGKPVRFHTAGAWCLDAIPLHGGNARFPSVQAW